MTLEQESEKYSDIHADIFETKGNFYINDTNKLQDCFEAGANSKFVMIEKLKAQIEATNSIETNLIYYRFKDITSYKETKGQFKDYKEYLQNQIKELQDVR
jgi:hypothetical protein